MTEKREYNVLVNSKAERAADDFEHISLSSRGTVFDDGETVTLKYTEQTDDGDTDNEVSFSKKRRGEVSVSRRGKISSFMTFESGKRCAWKYSIGEFAMDLCTNTVELENTLGLDGGKLSIYYIMESRGIEIQKVRLTVSLE